MCDGKWLSAQEYVAPGNGAPETIRFREDQVVAYQIGPKNMTIYLASGALFTVAQRPSDFGWGDK